LVSYIAAPKCVVSELLRDTSLIDDVTLAVEIDVVSMTTQLIFSVCRHSCYLLCHEAELSK